MSKTKSINTPKFSFLVDQIGGKVYSDYLPLENGRVARINFSLTWDDPNISSAVDLASKYRGKSNDTLIDGKPQYMHVEIFESEYQRQAQSLTWNEVQSIHKRMQEIEETAFKIPLKDIARY